MLIIIQLAKIIKGKNKGDSVVYSTLPGRRAIVKIIFVNLKVIIFSWQTKVNIDFGQRL